ncbi:MAG: acyl-[acyl-carrier-protein]--UDP-N-acetylglucosamine O-acyltransferase, partial [Gammaproteobacteria bacterium]|nr:acyl-[acyl-carrier-protein]--UDP-N-acetylglucosamine O-acyltransferase [Gammaproteobacteria bacterium]NIR98654.1 acyl-[acyl-carrier-protein]--UDP-N-acetylglucosamine O-acyltransferase [Gammaproteobacteria bacterium]NIT64368.1 acyl-[acyl-carrier-protein]--UDP-N-acetylglucosamine O-acyltransferase [Gammaproteobacteria bacterium]NIV21300.1 acyl-[acyl-carrier-protein]--UDP-N-acetylglucosamine O-acyltransferase [Gammaproteobacteria bacterium]NIX11058.1 acyl-[acyl-carrier-protein]--UDP-N-acetylglu
SIGAHAFSAMGSVIVKDVPPYVTLSGNPARPHGINAEGLKRRGFTAETVREIRRAYKMLYKSSLKLEEARARIWDMARSLPELRVMAEFLDSSSRSIIR